MAYPGRLYATDCAHLGSMSRNGRFRGMNRKPARKPKLTDAERHKRFVEMARRVEASNDPATFDKAFMRVASVRAKTRSS
jgi:hypothetical protein